MTTKTEQELKFEAAFLRGRDPQNPMVACLITKYVGQDNYSNPGTQAMFEMFVAGAAGVVVELPSTYGVGDPEDYRDDCHAAIIAAGGSVAP